MPGKIESEALQRNRGPVRYLRTEMLFPGEGLDLARVSPLPVRREDQRALVQIEQIGGSSIFGHEFNEDLIIHCGGNSVDHTRSRGIAREGIEVVRDPVASHPHSQEEQDEREF